MNDKRRRLDRARPFAELAPPVNGVFFRQDDASFGRDDIEMFPEPVAPMPIDAAAPAQDAAPKDDTAPGDAETDPQPQGGTTEEPSQGGAEVAETQAVT